MFYSLLSEFSQTHVRVRKKNHHFVRFVMYCSTSITTLPIALYWARCNDTVHYKSDKMVIFAVLDVQQCRL